MKIPFLVFSVLFAFPCFCCSTQQAWHAWGYPVVFCPFQSAQSLSNLTALPGAQGPPHCGLPGSNTPGLPSDSLTALSICPPASACLHPGRLFPMALPPSTPWTLGQASPARTQTPNTLLPFAHPPWLPCTWALFSTAWLLWTSTGPNSPANFSSIP